MASSFKSSQNLVFLSEFFVTLVVKIFMRDFPAGLSVCNKLFLYRHVALKGNFEIASQNKYKNLQHGKLI